jgi:hypothetical protein
MAVALGLLAYGTYGTIKLARQAAVLRRDALARHLVTIRGGQPAE